MYVVCHASFSVVIPYFFTKCMQSVLAIEPVIIYCLEIMTQIPKSKDGDATCMISLVVSDQNIKNQRGTFIASTVYIFNSVLHLYLENHVGMPRPY